MRSLRAGSAEGKKLTEEQIALLDDLGMNWESRSSLKWERGYQEALKYHNEHGNIYVPTKFVSESGFHLGEWISYQREGRIRITPERRAKLDALGMVWSREDPWERRFALAKAYYEENGDLNIPSRYVVDGIWLGKWLSEQRKIYQGKMPGKMLKEQRIQKLESIGMSWVGRVRRTENSADSTSRTQVV